MTETILEKLEILLPDADEDLLEQLVEQCMDDFMLTCNVDEVPENAASVVARMVVFQYNQRGAEGLSGQSYSGMSESYATDYPAPLKRAIYRFRRLRAL
jgi:hypothetical protein